MRIRDVLGTLVKALVEHPDDVRVAELDGNQTVIFELRCHPDDVGKVIGKSGRTVSAIRVLLAAVAARQQKKALLEVVD